MRSHAYLGALALLVAASPVAFAQDPGLAPPLQGRRATAPRSGTSSANRQDRGVDLRGTWTGEQTDRPANAPKDQGDSAPGAFVFERERRHRERYDIRVVANAADGSLRPSRVSGTFDGSRLTITWTPTGGVTGRIAALGSATQTATPRTVVYQHSADDDFDRLQRTSGVELPGGVPAPTELRRLKPPQVEFPAEWEQSEEILWAYQNERDFAVSSVYQAAIAGCAANGESAKHRIYASSEENERQLRYELAEALGPALMSRYVLFRRFAFGSVWIRDYGPWTVRTKRDHRRVVGDMKYFTGREDDDGIPADYARLRGWERIDLTSLRIEGGNIMSDGHGKLFTTNRTLEGSAEDANDEQDEVEASLRRVGASAVHFFERMPSPEGTGHIDMFAKLMDERTVLVGRHHSPDAAAVLERNAARFAALGYRVERVDFARPERVTDVGARGLQLMTYTNSLFVGRTVLVTQYSDAERDRQAMEIYRRLGWRPVGIDVRSIIPANGAIHCISMQVPAR